MINGNAKKITVPEKMKYNGSEVQSVIFNADIYTDKDAQKLLKKWKLKPMKPKPHKTKKKKKSKQDTEREDLLIYVNGFKKAKKGIEPKSVGKRINGTLRYRLHDPKKYKSFSTKRTKYDISFVIGFL